MVATNPLVDKRFIAANPQFFGLHALDVYTAVVEALGLEGVFVILDNHVRCALLFNIYELTLTYNMPV